MNEEDKQWYREMADNLVSTENDLTKAKARRNEAEAVLLDAMVNAPYESLYFQDYWIQTVAPEDGDVYLSMEPRPSVDLDL